MKSQIFKKQVESEILFNFLDKYALDKGGFYMLSNISYNKAKFHHDIATFCNTLLPYYHQSKQYYATRKMNYNNFTTIIRQVCKLCFVNYTSKTEYSNSAYNIVYYIYKPE
jgi:hypothetical protein